MAAYDDNNIFARILRGELPCSKAHETDHALAFHDINPQAPVHVLVIPKKEIPSLAHADDVDSQLLGHLLTVTRLVAKELGLDDGYRTVINSGSHGGQTVDHLHIHVLGGRHLSWPPG